MFNYRIYSSVGLFDWIATTIDNHKIRPWFFYYSFYGSADCLFWGFGKKIKLLLHTFLFSPTPVARPFLVKKKIIFLSTNKWIIATSTI